MQPQGFLLPPRLALLKWRLSLRRAEGRKPLSGKTVNAKRPVAKRLASGVNCRADQIRDQRKSSPIATLLVRRLAPRDVSFVVQRRGGRRQASPHRHSAPAGIHCRLDDVNTSQLMY